MWPVPPEVTQLQEANAGLERDLKEARAEIDELRRKACTVEANTVLTS